MTTPVLADIICCDELISDCRQRTLSVSARRLKTCRLDRSGGGSSSKNRPRSMEHHSQLMFTTVASSASSRYRTILPHHTVIRLLICLVWHEAVCYCIVN